MRSVRASLSRGLSKNRLLTSLVGASLALTVAGCEGAPSPKATVQRPASFHPLAYFMLVDGRMGVVDVFDMNVTQTIKVGHYGIHQVAVLPDNRTIYTGNGDTGKIVKITISEDGKTNTIKDIATSPINMHLFMASPDGNTVVMTSRLELKDTVLPGNGSNLPDDSILIIDTRTDKVSAPIALQSPAMAEFSKDGKTLFVSNVHHQTVSILDTATWTETARVPVGEGTPKLLNDQGHLVVSPDGMSVSQDGKYVATANMETKSVTVFEVANPSHRRYIDYSKAPFNGALPHDVRFTPDSQQIWVVDFATMADPGHEAKNAEIPTHVRIFDVATLTLQQSIEPPVMVQRTSLPNYSKSAFLTTGLGGVVEFDRKSGALQGQVVVGNVGTPVVCGMAMY